MSYKPESNKKQRNQQSWPNQDGCKISSGLENFMPVAKGNIQLVDNAITHIKPHIY